MKRIYRYEIPVDHALHRLELRGDVLHVAARILDGPVEIWVLDDDECPARIVEFRVFGTGEEVPKGLGYVDTATHGGYAWHLFEYQTETGNS